MLTIGERKLAETVVWGDGEYYSVSTSYSSKNYSYFHQLCLYWGWKDSSRPPFNRESMID